METAPLLTDEALAEIDAIGQSRLPIEACGILLPAPWRENWVYEMPNRSLSAEKSFKFHSGDVLMLLDNWFNLVGSDQAHRIAIWHTHPKGSIGPSRADLHNKVAKTHNLVVALTDNGPIPAWY